LSWVLLWTFYLGIGKLNDLAIVFISETTVPGAKNLANAIMLVVHYFDAERKDRWITCEGGIADNRAISTIGYHEICEG